MSTVSDLIGVLLPGGLAIGLVTIFQGVKSWREGKTSREESVINHWQEVARKANERSRIAEQDEAYAIILAEYWRTCYADLEFETRRNGMDVPEREPMPVKRMRGGSNATSRRGKARQTSDE